jgi:magnesium chelatase family protein
MMGDGMWRYVRFCFSDRDVEELMAECGVILTDTAFVITRSFRAPRHTISDVGLTGGGQSLMPGEVSVAHNGVLFLDELPEFRRHVLEVLRQPLEESVT